MTARLLALALVLTPITSAADDDAKDAAPEAPAAPARPDSTPPPSTGSAVPAVHTDPDLLAAGDMGRSYPMSLYGLVQFRDTVTKSSGAETSNLFAIQRARLLLLGNIGGPRVSYFLNAGFSASDYGANGVALFDAVVTVDVARDLVVRVGQFAYTLDRQQPIPPFFFEFVDRSPVLAELGADEDMGLQIGSNNLFGSHGVLRYKLFAGQGLGRNVTTASKPDFVYVGRLEINPFGGFDDYIEGDFQRSSKPRISLGFGAAYNADAHKDRGNFGATYSLGGFAYEMAAVDVTIKFVGVYILAEGLVRKSPSATRTGIDAGMAKTEYSRSAAGYFVQAGYMMSSYVELAARYSRLFKIADTDPALEQLIASGGHEVGGALSWYVHGTHGLQLQADYFYQYGANGMARQQARMQLQATF